MIPHFISFLLLMFSKILFFKYTFFMIAQSFTTNLKLFIYLPFRLEVGSLKLEELKYYLIFSSGFKLLASDLVFLGNS